MQVDLSSDQEFFKETTTRFLDERASAATVRAQRDDAAGFNSTYWRQGAELGWTSFLVPEARGGGSISGEGLVDLCLVAYEFGRHGAPGPLVATNLVAGALGAHEATGHQADVLAGLITGETIATWCPPEIVPAQGARSWRATVQANHQGGDVLIEGTATPVESAGQASHLLVTAVDGAGTTQLLVPADAPGVRVTPLGTVDLTRRFGAVSFDGVRVNRDAVVGEAGRAATEVDHQLLVLLSLLNAESVGTMQAGFDMTLAWAFDRYTFGRPLASYQAIKHRFADMLACLEASHAVADEATRAVVDVRPEGDEMTSAAKAYIGHAGAELLQECVQLHGGIGITFEHDLHLYLRRLTVNRALAGTPSEHRRRVARVGRGPQRGSGVRGALAADHSDDDALEDLDAFRERAQAFIRANLRPMAQEELRWRRGGQGDEEELAVITREREVQRMLHGAGLAGLCFPVDYGGHGLPPIYQRVLNEELVGYEHPSHVQVPTFSPCATVILEFGTEEQKRRHLPAILRGDELWAQFLSEPGGGSDVAGALTTAVRDGDQWVLNGSKVWTSGAWWSDWGLCLARTNWDVPKHRGLSVFMLPIHQDGVEVQRIEMLSGSREFCQEFMTDVIVPDSDRVGQVDDGWTVCTRWMFHERMLHTSPYVTEPVGASHGSMDASSVYAVASERGRLDDPSVRELVGEARVLEIVGDAMATRVPESIRSGRLSDQAAALVRLFKGNAQVRIATLALEVAGAAGAGFEEGSLAGNSAVNFLMRQAGSIGGGTVEMARNVISERVLAMPRERSVDKDVPFRDVPRGR